MTSGIFDLESSYQKRLIDYSAEITVILVHKLFHIRQPLGNWKEWRLVTYNQLRIYLTKTPANSIGQLADQLGLSLGNQGKEIPTNISQIWN